MERRMESLEVFVNKNNTISIQQDREHEREDPAIVTIHPDQVETLVKWLQAVKAEILEEERE
jgi:hypothetical protein